MVEIFDASCLQFNSSWATIIVRLVEIFSKDFVMLLFASIFLFKKMFYFMCYLKIIRIIIQIFFNSSYTNLDNKKQKILTFCIEIIHSQPKLNSLQKNIHLVSS